MSGNQTSWQQGQKDSQNGKGPQNDPNWTHQQRENYNAGYQNGKK